MVMKTRMLLFTVGLFGGFLLLFGFTPEPWNFLALAGVFALMLAQFSTSRAEAAVSAVHRGPVLTSPGSAVESLRASLGDEAAVRATR